MRLRRRSPEDRVAYLQAHRAEASAQGIPEAWIELLIDEALIEAHPPSKKGPPEMAVQSHDSPLNGAITAAEHTITVVPDTRMDHGRWWRSRCSLGDYLSGLHGSPGRAEIAGNAHARAKNAERS